MWNSKQAMISVFFCLIFPAASCMFDIKDEHYEIQHHLTKKCTVSGEGDYYVEGKINTFDHFVNVFITWGSDCDMDPDSSAFEYVHYWHDESMTESTFAWAIQGTANKGDRTWCVVFNCDNAFANCEIKVDYLLHVYTCHSKWNNGVCDDESKGGICRSGSDCEDCGTCDDSCSRANDGNCDEMRMDSDFLDGYCQYGTDCTDCSDDPFLARKKACPPPTPSPTPASEEGDAGDSDSTSTVADMSSAKLLVLSAMGMLWVC
jgi:hypothetical protein